MDIKVTYIDVNDVYSGVKAKLLRIAGWYDVSNALGCNGIQENMVIRIDRVFEEVSRDDTQDCRPLY